MFSKPLFIGCSGGGGHNAAIDAITKGLIKSGSVNEQRLPEYLPILEEEIRPSFEKTKISAGALVTNAAVLGLVVEKGIKAFQLPVLPSWKEIKQEVHKLSEDQKTKKKRLYVDMLLDVFPTGYQNAAIWNILQRKEETDELKKLIALQSHIDEHNYKIIYDYFLNKLKSAHEQRTPYTAIVSSQVMAIPAICDAVREYNRIFDAQVKIHQYLTDLPTLGAVHFFDSLSRLTKDQAQQVCLYGVNIGRNIEKIDNFYREKHTNYIPLQEKFAQVVNIDPKDNPMVRPGFKAESLGDLKPENTVELSVQVKDKPDVKYQIRANEKIAYIMLGSQAGEDTLGYVKKLAALKQYQKIFVFNGTSPHLDLKNKLQKEMQGPTEIVLLDNQDDAHGAAIRVRSDLAVIRGGGLTVMEEMALPIVNPEKIILFHSRRDKSRRFTSGISWEDENANQLIAMVQGKVKKITRTSVQEITAELTSRSADYQAQQGETYESQLQVVNTLQKRINVIRAKPAYHDFVSALDALHEDLLSYYSKTQKGFHLFRPKLSFATKIANLTIKLIDDLEKPANTDNQKLQNDLAAISAYYDESHKVSNAKFVARAMILVASAALGMVIGGIVCGAIGLICGAWSGPGAMASGVMGLFVGVYSGAALGLAVGSTISGAALTTATGLLLFKNNKWHNNVKQITEEANKIVKNKSVLI